MKDNSLKIFLWTYIALTTLAAAFVYGFIVKANGDNVEHLHMSWLIWQGNIPYRDFFQHHNPLLWYAFAPLVAALINHYEIFVVCNVLSIIALLAVLYYQARIMLLNGCSQLAALVMVAVGISSYSLLWSSNYRPDTFMFIFLLMGIYYLLKYIKKPETKGLVISFFAFFIAFMLTQKVLLNFVVLGCAIIYWLCVNKIKGTDFAKALVLPLCSAVLFCLYMYLNDALEIYWRANFIFNAYVPDIFEQTRIVLMPYEFYEFYIFVPLGLAASVVFIYKGTDIERFLSLMFIEELLLRAFYFSGFLHYCMFLLLLGIMLTFMFIGKYIGTKLLPTIVAILYLLFSWFYNYHNTYRVEAKKYQNMLGLEYAFYNLTPCDYAINGYYAVYNLKAKDPGYYSILLGQIDVLGEKTGIAPRDNLNALIREKLPKIISGEIYWDTYWEQRGRKTPAHIIDENLINTYYDYSGFGNLFILKPKYQKHMCRYNGHSWEYVD